MVTDKRVTSSQLYDLRKLMRSAKVAPNDGSMARYGRRLVELTKEQAAQFIAELQAAETEARALWTPNQGGIGPAPAVMSRDRASRWCAERAAAEGVAGQRSRQR